MGGIGTNLYVLKNWKFGSIFVLPLLAIWLCFVKDPDEYKKYLFILMLCGMYWMMDCMPLAAVGLIPLIFFPLLTLRNAKETMGNYMKDVTMMSFGCSMLALAAISSGIPKRIAFNILFLTRANFRIVMFYLMTISALFSMWFVNSAVMLFMMKVIEEITTELRDSVGIGALGDEKMGEWNKASSDLENRAKKEKDEETERDLAQGGPNIEPEVTNAAEGSAEIRDEKAPNRTSSEEPVSSDGQLVAVAAVESTEYQYTPSYASMIAHDRSQENVENQKMEQIKKDNDEFLELYKIDLFHSVAIAANIGGLLWPYTTTSSVALYHFSGIPKPRSLSRYVNLALWMNFTFPIIVIVFIVACIYMDYVNFGPLHRIFQCHQLQYTKVTAATSDTRKKVQEVYREKCKSLGKLNSHEKGAIFVLILSVFLFLLRRPVFMWGWTGLFTKNVKLDIKDSTVATFMAVLAFFIPKCGADMFRGPKSPSDKASFTALLGWKAVQQNFPWGLLIFIGGATSLAESLISIQTKDTNFTVKLDKSLFESFGPSPIYPRYSSDAALVLLVSMLIASALAHFITNTASAIIVAKVFGTLSYRLNFGYCYLVVPCLAVCSFSFLLPAGTPPMAIGHMKSHKLNGWVCFRKGWPLFGFAFFVVYFFGLFYTDSLMSCGN